MQLSLEAVGELELVQLVVEVLVSLVEGVVGQVSVRVVYVLGGLVLFTCKAHEPVLVEKDGHGVDDRRNEHVDPEVVLVLVPERRLLDVLLDDVSVRLGLHLGLVDNFDVAREDSVCLILTRVASRCCRRCLGVHLGCVVILLSFEVIVKFLGSLFELSVYLLLHNFQIFSDEDASTLTACLGLADEHEGWV